jgi:hypothetical protein
VLGTDALLKLKVTVSDDSRDTERACDRRAWRKVELMGSVLLSHRIGPL